MSTRITNTTGRIIGLAVALHSQAYKLRLRMAYRKELRAAAAVEAAKHELVYRQAEYADSVVAFEALLAESQANAAEAVQVRQDGTLRRPPPFGATPQVIDKRND